MKFGGKSTFGDKSKSTPGMVVSQLSILSQVRPRFACKISHPKASAATSLTGLVSVDLPLALGGHMHQYGRIIRDARQARGLTQAELADMVGVEATQVSRWERNSSPPSLANAVELSKSLAVSLDELADLVPLGVDLGGVWFAAWQTWRAGAQVIDTHGLIAKHHGERVVLNADGSYDWFGDFRFQWNALKGEYRATQSGGPANGMMFLAVTADRSTALGTWSGFTGEGKIGTGFGVISRSESVASDLLKKMIHDPASVTEWPIEFAGSNNAGV